MTPEIREVTEGYYSEVIKALHYVEDLEVAHTFTESEMQKFNHVWQTLAKTVGIIPAHEKTQ